LGLASRLASRRWSGVNEVAADYEIIIALPPTRSGL